MCLQKDGTVLHNHTVPHTRLHSLELNSFSGISLTEVKSGGGMGGKRRKREGQRGRDSERERKEEAMSLRESERFGIAYYIVKDISLLA